jgi:putative thioredoxin
MTQQPDAFNPYGAVDLAVLAQQRQAQERAAESPTPGGDAAPGGPVTVLDVTELTFEQDVLQRSTSVPVVIDFWADWCQPCKQLSPLLEQMAAADGGAWVLAKVDVDANQQLAAAAQVQSIPTVMVVWQGQVVPGFSGALPEPQVREFLNQVLALSAQAVEGGEAPEVPDPALDEADEALLRDDLDAAEQAYRAILADRPGNLDAATGLSRVGLLRRTQGVDPVAAAAAADAAADDVSAQCLAADLELLHGDVDAAVDRLIGLVRRVSGEDRDRAREHLVELFELVGNDDERVRRGRTALANALF